MKLTLNLMLQYQNTQMQRMICIIDLTIYIKVPAFKILFCTKVLIKTYFRIHDAFSYKGFYISESWYKFVNVDNKLFIGMLIALGSVFLVYLLFAPKRVCKLHNI